MATIARLQEGEKHKIFPFIDSNRSLIISGLLAVFKLIKFVCNSHACLFIQNYVKQERLDLLTSQLNEQEGPPLLFEKKKKAVLIQDS